MTRDVASIAIAREFTQWQAGAHRLHLFIDSLDECPQIDIALELIEELKDEPIDKLWLRVACRTAELPPAIHEELPRLWDVSADEVGVYELTPLRKKDVALAAGPHAEGFLTQVAARGAEALAIKPITLNFLLRRYLEHRSLPNTRWELYREGCRILCEETSATRRTVGGTGRLNADRRMSIAACYFWLRLEIIPSDLHSGSIPAMFGPL